MKFLIFGLGALGGVFATLLKETGHSVYAVGRPKMVEAAQNKGLKVFGIWGTHFARLDGVSTSADSFKGETLDVVILSVKSYDTEYALKELQNIRFKYLLLAQNGYGNYERAVSVFGKEKVVLSRIIFGARVVKPAEFEVTVCADDVVIGNPDRAIDEGWLKKLAKVLTSAGIPTRYSPDVYKYLWDKILYNCALNPLGALLETNYGTLAENLHTRKLMDAIIDEIFAVAAAKGIELFHRSADEYKKLFYEKLLPPTAGHYPSMYWDIKAGRRTEIDALNGAVVALGKEVGVPTPVNENITELVKAKEKLLLKRG